VYTFIPPKSVHFYTAVDKGDNGTENTVGKSIRGWEGRRADCSKGFGMLLILSLALNCMYPPDWNLPVSDAISHLCDTLSV